MIKQLIKIIYMKITKPAPRLRSAVPGTVTRIPRTRHVRVRGNGNITAGGDIIADENPTELSITPARLQELIDAGAIWVMDPEGDERRVQMQHTDRERREEQGRHDPRHCPCSGRHYPSPSACRWCACHRLPQGVLPGTPLADLYLSTHPVIESPVRPSEEIQSCSRCGHPQHTLGSGRCAFSVAPRMQDEPFRVCGCEETGDYPITDEAVDAAWDSFLGTDESEDGHS